MTPMNVNQSLYDAMTPGARQVNIDLICLGLGYTAVSLSNGCVGLAYTYFDRKTGCTLLDDYRDYEGRPAMEMLPLIKHPGPLERSMALALVNALAQPGLDGEDEDKHNRTLFDALNIAKGTRLAMVGFFQPLVKLLEANGVCIEVIDESRGIGNHEKFKEKLSRWADAVLVTSTTLLNSSFDDVISHVGGKARVALLGPSTPMVAEVFKPFGIKALAGIFVEEAAPVLKAVRHGLGTPHLHRYSRKITLTL